MRRPVPTPAGEVIVSTHAVARYVERVKPAFTHAHALYELARLLPQAEITEIAPWREWNPEEETDFWLVLCDSIAFPVRDGVVRTCVPRGNFGPVQRATRSAQNKWRRTHNRTIERKQRSTGARKRRKSQGYKGSGFEEAA